MPDRDIEDADAPLDFETLQGYVGAAMAIEYIDAKGQESRRRVTIRSIERTRLGEICLACYCHERRAPRRFLLHRVRAFVNLQTGEIVAGLQDMVPAAVTFTAPDAALSAAEVAVMTLRPGLNALLFIATCDGLHGSEVDALCEYVRDSPMGSRGVDDAELLRFVGVLHPDDVVFRQAIDRLQSADPDEVARVARHVVRITEADGTLSEAEFRFCLELKQALGLG